MEGKIAARVEELKKIENEFWIKSRILAGRGRMSRSERNTVWHSIEMNEGEREVGNLGSTGAGDSTPSIVRSKDSEV